MNPRHFSAALGTINLVGALASIYVGNTWMAAVNLTCAALMAVDAKAVGGVESMVWRLRLAFMLASPPFSWPIRQAYDYAVGTWEFLIDATAGDGMPTPAEALAEERLHWEAA